jgi:broad specificity phosphatase PhoE
MALLRYVSHPQVRVSADVPVPRWGLSDVGRRRVEAMCRQPWLATVERLISSDETKALETSAIIAARTGLSIEVRPDLHENDRTSTGFVPPERFEQLADGFFARPDESIEGWETARDAQRRVVDATTDLVAGVAGDVVVTGHGGVGTLLLCHLLGEPVSRDHDQTGRNTAPGGGNAWIYDTDERRVLHGWRPIEHLAPV